jgi:hypothetical protein
VIGVASGASSVAWIPSAATIWLADAPWLAVGIFSLLIAIICNLANIIRALAEYHAQDARPHEPGTVDEN